MVSENDDVEYREEESDQLPLEDTLLDEPLEDILDEGYSPPERMVGDPRDRDATGSLEPESFEDRILEEEPEIWDVGGKVSDDDRAGCLVDTADNGREQDIWADIAGVSGAGASAEEAAIHVIDDETQAVQFDDDVDNSG